MTYNAQWGERHPATVLHLDECQVLHKKTIETDGYTGGIDWQNHLVATKRVGTNSNKIHIWDMSFIREVCENDNEGQSLNILVEQEKRETFYMMRENSSSFQLSFYE